MGDKSKKTAEIVCRSCGSKSGPFRNLFDSPTSVGDKKVTLAEITNMLNESKKILKDDGLPEFLCCKCCDILAETYDLFRAYRHAKSRQRFVRGLKHGCVTDTVRISATIDFENGVQVAERITTQTAFSKPAMCKPGKTGGKSPCCGTPANADAEPPPKAESVKGVKCGSCKDGAEFTRPAVPKIVCSACNKEFLSTCGLSRHFRLNECDQQTSNYHTSSDEGPQVLPFPCYKCHKDFATEKERNKHMHKAHSNRNKSEPNPEPVEEPKKPANDEQTTNKKKKKKNKKKKALPST